MMRPTAAGPRPITFRRDATAQAIARVLEEVGRGGTIVDGAGMRWAIVAGPFPSSLIEHDHRLWMDGHGRVMDSQGLSWLIAAQRPYAALSDAHLVRATRHAAQALRWTLVGLWRTPSVRLALSFLGAAIVAGGVVVAGQSVAP